jgi:UMF1 family MFS transporter
MAPDDPASAVGSRKRAITSWALYDFANTIFYGVVVTAYLPGHVLAMTGGALTPYTLAQPPAMILAALLAPALGELVDRTGRARLLLGSATLVCVVLCASLALADSAVPLLVTFSCSLLAYNCALVFYNAMLPSVARDSELARVSGLGVGLGYLGVVFALPLAQFVVARAAGDPRPAFVLAAVLFAAFSVPLLVFCRDPAPKPRAIAARGLANAVAMSFAATAALLRRGVADRALLCFFLGNFLCADVLNAVYQLMVPFIEGARGLGIGKFWPLIAINVAALPAALLLGSIGDRTAPKPVMIFGAICLLLAVAVPQALIECSERGLLDARIVVAGAGAAALDPADWQVAAAGALVLFGALGVGGVLGAARKWLCRLTPAAEHGAWFGVYGLTNKLSLLGGVVFAQLFDRFGDYRLAVAFLAVELIVAIKLLSLAPRLRTIQEAAA